MAIFITKRFLFIPQWPVSARTGWLDYRPKHHCGIFI